MLRDYDFVKYIEEYVKKNGECTPEEITYFALLQQEDFTHTSEDGLPEINIRLIQLSRSEFDLFERVMIRRVNVETKKIEEVPAESGGVFPLIKKKK